jgi:hypothetical protein
MQKKDNIIFVDFWDAFENKLEKRILDLCHEFHILEKSLAKNQDVRNMIVYQLANLLLSNFVIKKQKEDITFIICEKNMNELEICEYYNQKELLNICTKILKKFEKYLCFTVIEYEGSFEQFTQLLSSDKIFYKKMVSKILNSLLKQSSKNFSMKDIQKVLKQYNLSGSALKKNYTMKFE